MEELLEIYDLDGNIIKTQKRDEFYNEIKEEFKKTGKITKQVKSIRMLLLNSKGHMYIQKRSYYKLENAGLYDKTIGGHVVAGHTLGLTVVKECHEELGFPAVVLTDDEFRLAIRSTDVSVIGLFRKIDSIPNFISVRRSADGDFKQPYITTFYVGYYDGSIRFKDEESIGIEVFTLKQLKERIQEEPEKFTEDLKFMIKKYEKYLVPIEKENKPVLGYEK